MKDTKRCFPQFNFYDRTGIQSYLEKQAEKGLRLQKIATFGWIFRRTEPGKIHYSVTYLPGISGFAPEPSENQKLFWEFCNHTGWKLAAANAQMQIFYNENEDPIPIETDAAVEVEKIHKSAKKAFLPIYFLLLISGLMQTGSFLHRLRYDGIDLWADHLSSLLGFGWFLILLYTITEIVKYFLWYRKAKAAAETEGRFVRTRGVGKGWRILLFLILGVFCLSFGDSMVAVISFVVLMVYIILIVGASEFMKRLKVSAAVNRRITIVLTIISGVGITGVIFMIVIRTGISSEKVPAETYEYRGWTYEVYHDELPLTVEDMTGEEYEGYSYEWKEEESVFLAKYEALQDPRADVSGLPSLEYTIVKVKQPFLYDRCLRELLYYSEYTYVDGKKVYEEYQETDAALWGADAAYHLQSERGAREVYLLCFGNCIVRMSTDWELTAEQMAVVGEKLGER